MVELLHRKRNVMRFRTLVFSVLFSFSLVADILPGNASEQSDHSQILLPIKASQVAPDLLAKQNLLQNRLHENQRRLLQLLGPQNVSSKNGKSHSSFASPETLRVLLVRMAFENDASGELTSVTSDGNYAMTPDPTGFIDPAPHNKAYFEAHLAAMAEYWSSMSDGLLSVEYQVVPDDENGAYWLSDMADYGPGSGGHWSTDLLEVLVRDMVQAADTGTLLDGSANLADYDDDDPNTCIILAHPGADWQSNLVWEPGQDGYSPNDIPSFFVRLGAGAGVALNSLDSQTGEPGFLSETSMIPEIKSQDGAYGSIASLLSNQVGHGLGLPDLYNTMHGTPGVGVWDLMGSGMNVPVTIGYYTPGDSLVVESWVGLLPPSIGIWSKRHRGWVEVDVVEAESREVELQVANLPSLSSGGIKAVEMVMPNDQRLLLENRWVPPAGQDLYLERDPETGVIQYLANGDGTNSHLYDYFLPTAGLLVWHVRDGLVAERLATNTLQYGTHRAVELIEADGIQNIGVDEPGYLGSASDAFRDASAQFAMTSTTLDDSYGLPGVLITGIDASLGTPMVFQVGAWISDVPGNSNGATHLKQNHPNPFNPQTTIGYEILERAAVDLRVFDVSGRMVRVLLDGEVVGPGHHDAAWNGKDENGQQVAAGVYFYRLESGAFSATKRMVLVK
jgi:hypothetical protein